MDKNIKIKQTIANDIVSVIKSEILSGKIKSGQRLGSEGDLCKRFKISRSTLREAIKVLDGIGLIITRRGRDGGVFVGRDSIDKTKEVIDSFISLKDSNICESLEFRRMFEVKMTFYAAINRGEKNLNEILKTIEDMKKNYDSPDLFALNNFRFHMEIANASKNSLMSNFYNSLKSMLLESASCVHKIAGQFDVTVYFHTQIYKAIRAKDSQRAEMLMNIHLSQLENDVKIAEEIKLKK